MRGSGPLGRAAGLGTPFSTGGRGWLMARRAGVSKIVDAMLAAA